jgi:hypothetical protein
MVPLALERAAREVVRRYPLVGPNDSLDSLGNHGGFSGASLWRVGTAAGPMCLKAWPAEGPSAARLAWIHGLMRRAHCCDLHFLPKIHTTRDGSTYVVQANRLWDLTDWMAGQADFHERPSPTRLAEACRALALVHGVWASEVTAGPSPAIARRLTCYREWTAVRRSGWQPSNCGNETFDTLGKRAWELLKRWLDWIPRTLATWSNQTLPLQPCFCDLWHDHVLYERDRLSALIDHGGLKPDHIAVDLARLLGSMAWEDGNLRSAGFNAYTQLRSLTWKEESLVSALDETGTIVGLANWLDWLFRRQRAFENPATVQSRLGELVSRVEGWHK